MSSAAPGEQIIVGINGFGRVGRALLRASFADGRVRVTAINDPFQTPEHAAYLLKHDSTTGPFAGTIEARKDAIVVDGATIAFFSRSDPAAVPWSECRVAYVAETSGVFTTSDRAGTHLAGGASRVVIAAASSDAPNIVLGANAEAFKPSMQVIAAGSCTGAALAPALRCLHEAVPGGVEEASFTCIHAATASQSAVDVPAGKEWRAGRALLNNIVPHSTGALRTLHKVLPSLAPRVAGSAFRVPVQVGCALDITVRFAAPTSKAAVEAALRDAAAAPKFAGALAFSTEELVSSDVWRTGATVFDSKASQAVSPTTYKLVFWFNNETGYAMRLLDLIAHTNQSW